MADDLLRISNAMPLLLDNATQACGDDVLECAILAYKMRLVAKLAEKAPKMEQAKATKLVRESEARVRRELEGRAFTDNGWFDVAKVVGGASKAVSKANPQAALVVEAAQEFVEAVGSTYTFRSFNADTKYVDSIAEQANFLRKYHDLENAARSYSAWATDPKFQRVLGESTPKMAVLNSKNQRTVPVVIADYLEPLVIDVKKPSRAVLQKAKKNPDGSVDVKAKEFTEALREEFKALTGTVNEAMAPITAELEKMAAQQETVSKWVNAQIEREEERKRAEEEAKVRTRIIAGATPVLGAAEGGLSVVVGLLGVADPKLAREVEQFGTAVISTARAGVELVQAAVNVVNAVTSGADIIGAVINAGAAAATGNFLGAATALVGLLFDSGPSVDEQILSEIKGLREDLEKLRKDVTERFDRVDRSLERIYNDVMGKLDRLEDRIEEVHDQGELLLSVLAEHTETLARIEQSMATFFRQAERNELWEEMDNKLWRPRRSRKPAMTEAEFQAAESFFYTWATKNCRSELEAPTERDVDDASLAAVLGEVGGTGGAELSVYLPFVIKVVQAKGWPDPAPSMKERLPNARTWSIAATAFAQLHLEWPGYAARFNDLDPDGRRNEVRQGGEQVAAVLRRLQTKKDAEGRTVLDLALADLRTATDDLVAAFNADARRVDEDNDRFYRESREPYVRMWPRTEPYPGFPPLPVQAGPPESRQVLSENLPALYRAVGSLAGAGVIGVRVQPHKRPGPSRIDRGGWQGPGKPPMNWGIKYYRWRTTLQVLFEGMVVQNYELESLEVRESVEFNTEERVLAGWAQHWAGRLKNVKPTPVPAAQAENRARIMLDDLAAEQAVSMLMPQVANNFNPSTGRLNYISVRYQAARALLVALISVTMPERRQHDDLLKALIDGRPTTQDGAAWPRLEDLLEHLTRGRGPVPQLPPPGASANPFAPWIEFWITTPIRHLPGVIRQMTAEWSLEENKDRIPDPSTRASLALLEASAGVVVQPNTP